MPTENPHNGDLAIVLLTTFVAFCALYAPQPILPQLSAEFNVSSATSGLLITITFLGLCVAPPIVGWCLNHISARHILVVCTALLAILQYLFSLSTEWHQLLLLRAAQACLYPAIFTAAVTYSAQAGPRDKMTQRVGLYIATTIIGGLGGRLASGFISDWFDWQRVFLLLCVTLLICTFALGWISPDTPARQSAKTRMTATALLKKPAFALALAFVFTTFFCFSATLNALPFRMVELDNAITAGQISLVYLGYSTGVLIAANASALSTLFGGRLRALGVGLSVFTVGLTGLFAQSITALVVAGFFTAAGHFLIHATVSGLLNQLEPESGGSVNGLYISLYYYAGASGSILPVLIYQHIGWIPFLVALIAISSLGWLTLWQLFSSQQIATLEQPPSR